MQSRYLATAIFILIIVRIKAQENVTCGKRLVHHEGLITNGFRSKEGEWPWHAALYHISTTSYNSAYKCGGSLLTSNSVLTAAHCVYNREGPIAPDAVVVYLGRHSLRIFSSNSQAFQVYNIIAHPNYSPTDDNNDIAIIRLATEATLTNYVQPICLWDSNRLALSDVIGKFGTVIGWGLTEDDKLSDTLRQAVMPVVPSLACLTTHRDFFGAHLSQTNYCAGFRNGTSVCNGDSGGSMTFKENGVYYIRGIVSVSLSRLGMDGSRVCDSNHYVIFTDVAQYLPWIEETIPELKRSPAQLDFDEMISIIDTEECGNSDVGSTAGAYPNKDRWPWLAPLIIKAGDKFLCGSNLINNQFLLSVAHCFQRKDNLAVISANNIYAYLGGLNESFSLKADIYVINIHPDWNSFVKTYDGDIALLKTKNVITFNDYIQPVCLSTAQSPIFNLKGIVVGNKRSSNETIEETRSRDIEIKSIKDDICLLNNPALAPITSQRMFCAGGNEKPACDADSGSGFFVKLGDSYGIIGIVSSTDCTKNELALFTSVPNYVQWIFNSFDENAEDWTYSKINCLFHWNKQIEHYECYASSFYSAESTSDNIKISSIEGTLNDGMTYADVSSVSFENSKARYIPEMSALKNVFPNFKQLLYTRCELEHVQRSKLRILQQLEMLYFYKIEITTLSEDVLYDLPHLEIFAIVQCAIRFLPENLLSKQYKLKKLWADHNKIETIPKNFFKNNKELTHIFMNENSLKTIYVNFNELLHLDYLHLGGNECIDQYACNTCPISYKEIQNIVADDCGGVGESSLNTEECEKKVHCSSFEHFESGLLCRSNLQIKSSEKNCKIIFNEIVNIRLFFIGEMDAIPDISDVLNKFENIKDLDLGFLQLKNIERTKLRIIKQMSYLSLFGNLISELKSDTFDDLKKINKLLLANNRLKVLHPDLFKELRNLTELWLFNNQLEFLPENLFRNNHELMDVFIQENNLKTISTDFRNLAKLQFIDLRTNVCINEFCEKSCSKEEFQKTIWDKCTL